MKPAPLVSVLMTAYNREKYIAAAIESVLAQTFEDFELLIIDDCSQDRTVEIAQTYCADSRVRVFVNQSNLGDYPNRNYAVSLARGQYIKYHDSDDLMYPQCLSIMAGLLGAEPRADFGLTSSSSWPGGPCPMLLTPRMCYQREFLGLGMFHLGPACALFRSAFLREIGGFPLSGTASDLHFWLGACARAHVLLLPGDLFWYRIHAAQELQSSRAQLDTLRAMNEVWRALQSPVCPLHASEREQAKRNWTYILARETYRDLRAGRWQVPWLRFRHAGLSFHDWLRYLRPARRDRLAGTPLDASGEYLMPDWRRFEVSARIPQTVR